VALAVALATFAGGAAGTSAAHVGLSTASLATFRSAMINRLRAEQLDYRWVACVRSGRRFEGVPVVRCNVDFGIDPHVQAYCSVLRRGRLLTSEEDPAIPCGADNAGYSGKLTTYG
jgi:hypothetical protein